MAILNKANLTSKIVDQTGKQRDISVDSNTHRLNNISTDIVVIKSSAESWVLPKDRFLVTTTITNNTDQILENMKFKDTLTKGATFVDGTLKIGSQPYTNLNPLDSFDMPVTLDGLGASLSVSYEILIDEFLDETTIENATELTVIVDSKEFLIKSNTVTINVIDNEITLLKSASTTAAKVGDTITYSILITNAGTSTNTNVVLTDALASQLEFVADSVKIDGTIQTGANPQNGITLPNLEAGKQITVQFDVTIKQ